MELRSGNRQLRSQNKTFVNKNLLNFQVDTPKTLSKTYPPKRKSATSTKEPKKHTKDSQPQQHVFISENIQVAKSKPKKNNKESTRKAGTRIENPQNIAYGFSPNEYINFQTKNIVFEEMVYQNPQQINNELLKNKASPSSKTKIKKRQNSSPFNVFSVQGYTEANTTSPVENSTVSKPVDRPFKENYQNSINFITDHVPPTPPTAEPKTFKINGYNQSHSPNFNEGVLELSQPYYVSSPLGRTTTSAPSKADPTMITAVVEPLPKKRNLKQDLGSTPSTILQVLSPRAHSPDAPTSRGSFSQFQIDLPLKKANRHNGKSKITLRYNRLSLPSSDPYEVPGREVELAKTIQVAPAHPPLDLENWDDLVDRVITVRANLCDSLTVFILWLDGKCTAHLFDEVKTKSPQKYLKNKGSSRRLDSTNTPIP